MSGHPEPFIEQLMIQTVFEKLWVVDGEAIGTEPADPYLDLLTLEAQLTLRDTAETATDGLPPSAESLGRTATVAPTSAAAG